MTEPKNLEELHAAWVSLTTQRTKLLTELEATHMSKEKCLAFAQEDILTLFTFLGKLIELHKDK